MRMSGQEDENAGRDLLEKIIGKLKREGRKAGLKYKETDFGVRFRSAHAEVTFEFGGTARHRDYLTVIAKVAPEDFPQGHIPRPSFFRVVRAKATPEVIAAHVGKIVGKAREINEHAAELKRRKEAADGRRAEENRVIREAVAQHLPGCEEQHERCFRRTGREFGDGEELTACVERQGEEGDELRVFFQMRISDYLTPEEARAVGELLDRLRAARNGGSEAEAD